MIALHKLVPPENSTLFERFPELNEIWEVPALQKQARESYEKWGVVKYENEREGEIFSIEENGVTIGVIGWFEYGDFSDVLRLVYYGIVPSKRGNHYGQEAIKLFLLHLSKAAPAQYVWLAESVTLARTSASKIITYFKNLGFEEFDDPNYGSNAGCGPVKSLKIRIPGR
jgi:hypothetical protein